MKNRGHKKFIKMVVIIIVVPFGFFYSFGSLKHLYFFFSISCSVFDRALIFEFYITGALFN